MFTGITQGKGTIFETRPSGGGLIFGIDADFEITHPEEGESIAINGVCLTAKNIAKTKFYADISPESLTKSNLGALKVGSGVNLERALRLTDRLGGHIVSGHVDAVTEVVSKEKLGDFTIFTFRVPEGLGKYIITKGSVTLDGISLTVNTCDSQHFSVSIIPHTLEVTMLGKLQPGTLVNLEVDIIGKYVEKLLLHNSNDQQGSKINESFLAEHGFLK